MISVEQNKKKTGSFNFFKIESDATVEIILSLYEKTGETDLNRAIEKALLINNENDIVFQNACFLKVVMPYNQHLNNVYQQLIQKISVR